jgi:hypothetical protein
MPKSITTLEDVMDFLESANHAELEAIARRAYYLKMSLERLLATKTHS